MPGIFVASNTAVALNMINNLVAKLIYAIPWFNLLPSNIYASQMSFSGECVSDTNSAISNTIHFLIVIAFIELSTYIVHRANRLLVDEQPSFVLPAVLSLAMYLLALQYYFANLPLPTPFIYTCPEVVLGIVTASAMVVMDVVHLSLVWYAWARAVVDSTPGNLIMAAAMTYVNLTTGPLGVGLAQLLSLF